MVPEISQYGGPNTPRHDYPSLNVTVWYSYSTPVAFRVGNNMVVHDNEWSKTTGKHLNLIDGGSEDARKLRVTSDAFHKLWAEQMPPELRK